MAKPLGSWSMRSAVGYLPAGVVTRERRVTVRSIAVGFLGDDLGRDDIDGEPQPVAVEAGDETDAVVEGPGEAVSGRARVVLGDAADGHTAGARDTDAQAPGAGLPLAAHPEAGRIDGDLEAGPVVVVQCALGLGGGAGLLDRAQPQREGGAAALAAEHGDAQRALPVAEGTLGM